jgi:hypothetical protein
MAVPNTLRERVAQMVIEAVNHPGNPRLSALALELRQEMTDILSNLAIVAGERPPRDLADAVEREVNKALNLSVSYAVRVALLALVPDR